MVEGRDGGGERCLPGGGGEWVKRNHGLVEASRTGLGHVSMSSLIIPWGSYNGEEELFRWKH